VHGVFPHRLSLVERPGVRSTAFGETQECAPAEFHFTGQ
jgi:hypothetical protein